VLKQRTRSKEVHAYCDVLKIKTWFLLKSAKKLFEFRHQIPKNFFKIYNTRKTLNAEPLKNLLSSLKVKKLLVFRVMPECEANQINIIKTNDIEVNSTQSNDFLSLSTTAYPSGQNRQKSSLKECVSALKIQCHIVKNTLLQNDFSAILLTGIY